jgi:antitoxin StbD
MHHILTEYSTSITDLKRNPNALLAEAHGMPIAILNHNKPVAYLVPAYTYEAIIDMLEDKKLVEIIVARENEIAKAIEINLDDL